jgi:hypothetical protein
MIAPNCFRNDERGGATLLALFLFFTILLISGLGVDVMRHEMYRAKLQANLDAAVLSAASAPYDTDPATPTAEDRIKDHFLKAGLEDFLHVFEDGDVVVTESSTKISASASQTFNTHLMRMAGVDTMTAAAGSTARTSVEQLEISLVLDVSGSMAGDRISALKTAAKSFVTQILNNSDGGKVAFSIVPYSFNAAPPEAMYNALSANTTHHYSRCLTFPDKEFEDAFIDPARGYAQTVFTSVDYSSWNNADFGTVGNGDIEYVYSSAYNASCYDDLRFDILAYSSSETDLHDKIDSLTAAGGTSSDMGAKWGAALLDPKFAPVATALQTNAQTVPVTGTDGNVSSTRNVFVGTNYTSLPEAYGSANSMKIMVIMGDGANSSSYVLRDPNGLTDPDVAESHASADYRGPDSDLYLLNEPQDPQFIRAVHDYYGWVSTWEGYCSYDNWTCEYTPGNPKPTFYLYSPYYNDFTNLSTYNYISVSQFNDKLSGLTETDGTLADLSGSFDTTLDTTNLVKNHYSDTPFYERFSWEEAWGLMTPYEYGNLTGSWGAYNQYNYQSTNVLTGAEKNARMVDTCSAADLEGVTIYTIAFELGETESAATELEKCASIPANHFISDTLNIKQTFGTIAANVMALKLTQ